MAEKTDKPVQPIPQSPRMLRLWRNGQIIAEVQMQGPRFVMNDGDWWEILE